MNSSNNFYILAAITIWMEFVVGSMNRQGEVEFLSDFVVV